MNGYHFTYIVCATIINFGHLYIRLNEDAIFRRFLNAIIVQHRLIVVGFNLQR
jgi:hypothetical protein